jgi:hypothetical protein
MKRVKRKHFCFWWSYCFTNEERFGEILPKEKIRRKEFVKKFQLPMHTNSESIEILNSTKDRELVAASGIYTPKITLALFLLCGDAEI